EQGWVMLDCSFLVRSLRIGLPGGFFLVATGTPILPRPHAVPPRTSVFALDPIGRAAGMVRRGLALREAHLEGMSKPVGPSASMWALRRRPDATRLIRDAKVLLRVSSGSRRRSSLSSSIRSKTYRNTLASWRR